MEGEIFLSWGVLIAIGVVSKGFPKLTMGPQQHMVVAAATRDLGSFLEKFQDVFGEAK